MSRFYGLAIAAILVLAAAAGYYGYQAERRSHTQTAQTSISVQNSTVTLRAASTPETSTSASIQRVRWIVDGDTLTLQDGAVVRLLGINAPERGHALYQEAKERLASLVLGREVRLEADWEDKDRQGRLLRYVFVDGCFVNAQLVREGLASVFMESGLRYRGQLLEAERYARLQNLGIWEAGSAHARHIYIVEFHYDAAGEDDQNLNDEYVVLGNRGDLPLNLTGWTISDEANHVFTFPAFTLEPGGTVTVYTGYGADTESSLYWGITGAAVWNNDGDTLFLRDEDGNLVLAHGY
ncbi:MAG: lamin tail domain-containing protein [Candidatus Bathyarchaeia archaeon]